MSHIDNLPYLIKLLEDDSDQVRSSVQNELRSFGPLLKEHWPKYVQMMNAHQRELVNDVWQGVNSDILKKTWSSWFALPKALDRLEVAFCRLSEFQNGLEMNESLSRLLDGLAEEYRKKDIKVTPYSLACFLFKDKSFKGTTNDYYNPQNHNLVYVIKKKRGVPISLTCIYMLVGKRLGLTIDGCNLPGHFLARIELDGRKVFIDCFNRGQIWEDKDLTSLTVPKEDNIEDIMEASPSVEDIVARALKNLLWSYGQADDEGSAKTIRSLLLTLEDYMQKKEMQTLNSIEDLNIQEPKFKPGQILRHKLHGYRALIVDFDLECMASDSWYYSNQSQPKRRQPWYHVLVDNSDHVTYAAESNLEASKSDEPFNHPLVEYFFTQSKDGHFVRNNQPWPQEDELE